MDFLPQIVYVRATVDIQFMARCLSIRNTCRNGIRVILVSYFQYKKCEGTC